MLYHRFLGIGGLCGGLLLAGCVASNQPAKPQTHAVTYSLPAITPSAGTNASQSKGGITISLAAPTYEAKKEEKLMYVPTQPPPVAVLLASSNRPEIWVKTTQETTVTPSPDRVKFMVKINNGLPRVFHGAGTVVQFNVGGQLQPVHQQGYAALVNAIIPPQTEQEIEIVGPTLDALKGSNGIIGIFFYDVPTNQNEAGVITEKQNFQWYFNYKLQPVTEQAAFKQDEGWMYTSDYNAWRAKQMKDQVMQQISAQAAQ